MSSISTQILIDDRAKTILRVFVTGTGAGDLTNTVIFDASAYTTPTTNTRLMWIDYATQTFNFTLAWDDAVDLPFYTGLADYQVYDDFRYFGGIVNNGGATKTGDLLLTTSGLGGNEFGHLIFEIRKATS